MFSLKILSSYFNVLGVPISFWLIVFVSVYLNFKFKFFNIKEFPKALKALIFNDKHFDQNNKSVTITSPIKAFFVQMSSVLGVGNMSGSLFALYFGGPGTALWVLIFSFFFAILKFSEIVLVRLYKHEENLVVRGGMFYVMKSGLKKVLGPKLSSLMGFVYALLIVLIVTNWSGFQMNQIVSAIFDGVTPVNVDSMTINILPFSFAVFVFGVVFFILIGDVKRISSLASALILPMCISYVFIIAFVLIAKCGILLETMKTIFISAFDFKAIVAGGFSVLTVALSRILMATEAGLGTSAIPHANSSDESVIRQAFLSFLDVMFVALIVSLGVVMLMLLDVDFNNYSSVSLHITKDVLGGLHVFLKYLFVLTLFFFGFTTLVGNGYYVFVAFDYLIKLKSNIGLYSVYVLTAFFMSIFGGSTLIEIIDMLCYCALFPNVLTIFLLSGDLMKQLKIYTVEMLGKK